MEKSHKLRCIEFERGKSLETLLTEGIERGLSLVQIADELGVTALTLRVWARQLGAEIRTRREVRFRSREALVG